MESELLQLIVVFVVGLVCGALIMLLWNKLSSGSASASGLKQEYQDYQEKVETHFEHTSKKFQDMTEQYQDLYKHLSVGATSLCRPDSVAAALADESKAQVKIGSKQQPSTPTQITPTPVKPAKVASKPVAENKAKDTGAKVDAKSASKDSVKGSVKGASKNPIDNSKASSVASNSANKKKGSSS
jgi:uncharacterized membrane-anchored protein YhcB (DUF1043 family)